MPPTVREREGPKDGEVLKENRQALEKLRAQLKQRGYSSKAIEEILKWYR